MTTSTSEINALLFPDTRPRPAEIALLATVCDRLRHYALPGSEPIPGVEGSLPVAMPHADQERFQLLMRDIKGHEAEFHASQLASLVAGRSDRQEAAAWSLVSSIRSGATPPPVSEDPKEAAWRAMLVLRLAEMLREEEEEIARGLAAISGLEEELLAELKGGEELDEDEAAEIHALTAGQPLTGTALDPVRLCKAWATLYPLDSRASEATLLATPQEDAATLLADRCEALTGQPPVPLCSLLLPAGKDADLEGLRKALAPQRQALAGILAEVAATGQPSARLSAVEADMQRAVAPWLEDSPSVRPLTLYGLRGISFAELFDSLRQPAARQTAPAAPATVTLAVLGGVRPQR
ncbi:MAG: hypothetical protein ACOY3Z_09665 [Thermodesulfobacteriota bacterium]